MNLGTPGRTKVLLTSEPLPQPQKSDFWSFEDFCVCGFVGVWQVHFQECLLMPWDQLHGQGYELNVHSLESRKLDTGFLYLP